MEFARARNIGSFDDLAGIGVTPTERQRKLVENSAGDFAAEWARVFVADKFGMATTHWDKLQERVGRGVRNPCPLVLIGIPSRVIAKSAGP